MDRSAPRAAVPKSIRIARSYASTESGPKKKRRSGLPNRRNPDAKEPTTVRDAISAADRYRATRLESAAAAYSEITGYVVTLMLPGMIHKIRVLKTASA